MVVEVSGEPRSMTSSSSKKLTFSRIESMHLNFTALSVQQLNIQIVYTPFREEEDIEDLIVSVMKFL